MRPLTKQEKENYINGGGGRCPYCDSPNISSCAFEADITIGWQNVVCHDCEAEWQDIWELTGVEEVQ